MLAAILAWGGAAHAFEHHAHVFRVIEARQLRNSLQGEVGFREQLFDAVQADGADFLLRVAFQVFPESALEHAAGDADLPQDIVHAAAKDRLFMDEPQGRGYQLVVDGQHFGGAPRDDLHGIDGQTLGPGRLAGKATFTFTPHSFTVIRFE
jgi:hypothetical protein